MLKIAKVLSPRVGVLHLLSCLAAVSVLVVAAAGAVQARVEMTVDATSGAPAGTTFTWTVATDRTGYEVFALAVGPAGEPALRRTVYDFRTDNRFEWTPHDEGNYTVVGRVRNLSTGESEQAAANFLVGPRTEDATLDPVITGTENPLVAYYTAPACPVGQRMRVRFFAPPSGPVQRTHSKPCRAGLTMNFQIGGMRPQTAHAMRHELLDGGGAVVGQGPLRFHQTGSIVPQLAPSTVELTGPEVSQAEQVILQSPVGFGIGSFPFAVDLQGIPIWYENKLNRGGAQLYGLMTRPGGRGTFYSVSDTALTHWDLLGNVIRQTTVPRLNEQLAALGLGSINNLHHEARPLPNGHLALIGAVERLLVDVQGPGPVDVIGDMILVLDENLQVAWTWNAFDHLDASRLSRTDKTCPATGKPGCPVILLITEGSANDWLHTNSITYSPADGNLVISIRHQDWLVKLAYKDGAGDGAVLWKLGVDGDFAISPANPSGWFSHQHDANFMTATRIVLYDNYNVVCDEDPECVSRGQVIELNEVTRVATLIRNDDLGEYAPGSGSSQPLVNGNSYFDSGFDGPTAIPLSHAYEFLPDGTLIFRMLSEVAMYRSHRLTDLYHLPAWWGIPQD